MRRKILAISGLTVTGWIALAALMPASDGTLAPELDHSLLDPIPLVGSVLNASESFGMPTSVAIVGRHVVIADGYGDPALHVLDKRSGELLYSLGVRGEGPGEFESPRSIDPGEADDEVFWVFDGALQRLTRIDLAADPDAPLSHSRTLALRSGATLTTALWAGEERVITVGFFSDGRLGFFDADGAFSGTAGELPAYPGEVAATVLQQAFMGRLAADPARSQVAVASRHAGLIELIPLDGQPAVEAETPFPFDPKFSVQATDYGPVMIPVDHTRFGYIDVAASTDRVYGLFSGRTIGAYPEDANYAQYVHVFEWNGRFRQALQVDPGAFAITVDEEEGVLYVLRHLPTPALLKYELGD